jgi:prepilin-type N-terminal cleavage/methylation domain-containing protein
MNKGLRVSRGFSLIELVIVVVIIGIIAAIAIPRMSRGSAGASANAQKANVVILENAIELYAVEHNGNYPAGATITAQLTGKTELDGSTWVSTTGTADPLGPYLKAVPPNKKGLAVITTNASDTAAGWLYNQTTHAITAINE